jgi:hypothetical protein
MIVGFCGLAFSGKGEAARYLIEKHGFATGTFASSLKEMLRTFLRYRGVDDATIGRMLYGDLKEVPSDKLGGKTPRWAMQSLGTEWGRDLIDYDLWVDTEMDHVAGNEAVVFDDVRFPNEEAAIRDRGGIIIRVVRDDGGSSHGGHISENLPISADVVIDNNGTVAELHSKIEALLGEYRAAA